MNEFFSSTGGLIFIGMVAVAAFLLTLSLTVPAFGPERQAARRLRKRINRVGDEFEQPRVASLLREQYLRRLSPLERWLEFLPGMPALRAILQQAGSDLPAYRLVLASAAMALGGLAVGAILLGHPIAIALLTAVAGSTPLVIFVIRRNQRLARFDEQLPEALEIMTRALRAGHPFNETLKLVSEDMDDPIASEFGATFADINYGADVRSAFLGLLERAPSMSLMVMVMTVLVQRETGGNLSEVLEKIASIIRGRFRFQRKVRTLSAEGRLSAWILAMVPFVLFAAFMFTTPDYLPVLVEHPTGQTLIMVAFGLLMVGALWMRRVIRIDV